MSDHPNDPFFKHKAPTRKEDKQCEACATIDPSSSYKINVHTISSPDSDTENKQQNKSQPKQQQINQVHWLTQAKIQQIVSQGAEWQKRKTPRSLSCLMEMIRPHMTLDMQPKPLNGLGQLLLSHTPFLHILLDLLSFQADSQSAFDFRVDFLVNHFKPHCVKECGEALKKQREKGQRDASVRANKASMANERMSEPMVLSSNQRMSAPVPLSQGQDSPLGSRYKYQIRNIKHGKRVCQVRASLRVASKHKESVTHESKEQMLSVDYLKEHMREIQINKGVLSGMEAMGPNDLDIHEYLSAWREEEGAHEEEETCTMPAQENKEAHLIEPGQDIQRKEQKRKYELNFPLSIRRMINPDINEHGIYALVELGRATQIELKATYAITPLTNVYYARKKFVIEDHNYARSFSKDNLAYIPYCSEVARLLQQ